MQMLGVHTVRTSETPSQYVCIQDKGTVGGGVDTSIDGFLRNLGSKRRLSRSEDLETSGDLWGINALDWGHHHSQIFNSVLYRSL